VLDAGRSPAQQIPPELLGGGGVVHGPFIRFGPGARACDEALRWLTASDRIVCDQVGRALLEVKEARLHEREGHARWSTYLRAFVPLTARWSQLEMKRARALRDYPALAEAWSQGEIDRSHLRVILRVVTPETEETWCEHGKTLSVRKIELLAFEERRRQSEVKDGTSAPPEARESDEARSRRHSVMAPPGVAVLVGRAVDLARKVEGYQISTGGAVAIMAMEVMSGLTPAPDEPPEEPEEGAGASRKGTSEDGSLLGDGASLRREMGRAWPEIHRQVEEVTRHWSKLRWDAPGVLFEGAPADDADPHERVVFWTAVQGRLDAVRGRLLRVVQQWLYVDDLKFASLGQYVRERMGLSLREAEDLIRLDRALEQMPAAFRMYAAGRMGKCAAWLVSKVATRQTDRAWTRFAMTHTLRLLEVVVEGAILRRETDPRGWKESGGLPPETASFADATRACSFLEAQKTGDVESSARIRIVFDAEQWTCYEQAVSALRANYGADRPEWWCLAVMARHFLDMYEQIHETKRGNLARRVFERDNFTCAAPECLQRGGLECDHILMRSRGGPDAPWNRASLCHAEHRFSKHVAGTLVLYGEAPDHLTIRMGSRVYRNDRLVSPAFDEKELDVDPWAGSRVSVAVIT
jgi:hypothetical protein